MNERSSRVDVRNPILTLSAAARIREHPAAADLSALLRELSADAAQRAEQCWRKSKGPMAVYWKAVSVYAKHIARAIA